MFWDFVQLLTMGVFTRHMMKLCGDVWTWCFLTTPLSRLTSRQIALAAVSSDEDVFLLLSMFLLEAVL